MAEQHVPVGEQPDVVDLPFAAGGVSPDHFALIHEKDRVVTLARIKHGMPRDSAAG